MIRIQKFYYLMLKIIIYIDYLYIHIYIFMLKIQHISTSFKHA